MFLVKTIKLALKIHRPLVQYGDRTPQTALSEMDSEFQTTNACVTVSLLPAGVIYGDSSTALFRRGGGRRELFPCSCEVRVAQPSLSQQIRKLEAEIGQPLFDRLPSQSSDRGGPMFHRIRAANFSVIGDARGASMNSQSGHRETRVGAIPTIAPYVLPELVKKFHKDYPEVTLELVEDVTDGITRRVEAGELDVALASTCQQSPSLRRESLGHEPLLRAGARGRPARKADSRRA
jgi:Transcriptional regulator